MIELDIVKNDDMEMLLKDISHLYGYDFTQYSKASLKRRLNRICMLDKFTSFAELRYRLIHDGAYLSRFIEEITVNVTEMFRAPHFYATLRHHILPVLRTYPFIRIWVAGCSSGEEACSSAIVLTVTALFDKPLIDALEINPSLLEMASKGIFPLSQIKHYASNYILSGVKRDFSSYYIEMYDVVKFT